jgi:hypothetical protein
VSVRVSFEEKERECSYSLSLSLSLFFKWAQLGSGPSVKKMPGGHF